MTRDQDQISILLIDDRVENLTALEAALENLNLKLYTATSGRGALARLEEQHSFALILLDVQMPGMDGFETARKIRENPKWRDIPIILVTAIDSDSSYIARAYQFGVADFIFKPVDLTILRSKVALFAELCRKRRQLEQQAELIQKARESEHARMNRLVTIQQGTSQALTDSKSLSEAMPKILETICENLRWCFGAFWRVDFKTNVIRCDSIWHVPDLRINKFLKTTLTQVFAPGIGIPGRVWQSGKSEWVEDLFVDKNFPRISVAKEEGLRSAVAFPVCLGKETLGVVEFFSRELHSADHDLLDVLAAIGSQIGQFLKRSEATLALAESESFKSAILEAALDCIISMDDEGRVIEFNPAAEKTFGYQREEAIGRDMADLIIPPHLRNAHRRGLAHFLKTGEGPVLARRIEVPAIHKNGTEFPVELTITVVRGDGPPRFTGYLREITEQKRIASELQLKSDALENSLNAFDIVNAEGKFIYANRAYLTMWGYESLDEVLGTSPVSHCADPSVPEKIIRTLKERNECNVEFVARRKDGSTFDVQMWARRAHDSMGNEIYPSTSIDITERKRVEQTIKQSEEQFRTLANSISQLAWMANADGWIYWYNQRWYDYTGTTLEEMKGWGWEKIHHPDHRERVVSAAAMGWKKGEPFELTFPLKSKTGEWRWFLTRVVPIHDSRGNLLNWFGTNTDIQKQKEVEEKVGNQHLRAEEARQELYEFFMQAPVPLVVLLGAEHRFSMANPPYERFVGRKVVGKTVLEAFSRQEVGHFIPLLDGVYKTGKPYVGNELPLDIPDEKGTIQNLFVNVGYHAFRDPDGTIKGILAVLQDVTEQVHARRKVERLAADLQTAVRVRDEFLSIASHELKTPITSLKLQLQMTQRQVRPEQGLSPSPEKLAKVLDISTIQVNRLTSLVEDLLDVTRINEGKLSFNYEETDLSRLVKDIVEELAETMRATKCTLRVHAPAPVVVSCDRARIEQVIINLLSNAMKYGAGQPIEISSSLGSKSATLTVKDFGMGIPKDKQEKIFGRFERAVDSRNISGLGLGLYISREIIEAHRGSIRVESEPGKGSTFTIEIPIHAEDRYKLGMG